MQLRQRVQKMLAADDRFDARIGVVKSALALEGQAMVLEGQALALVGQPQYFARPSAACVQVAWALLSPPAVRPT